MNTEHTEITAQPAKRHVHYEAHYNDTGHIIWEAIEDPLRFTPEQPKEPPVLNRAQRRHIRRTIARKAHAQLHIVQRRHNIVNLGPRCPHCDHYFLGPSVARCQCKATAKRNQ